MGLRYQNLDEETRRYMVEEIDLDVERGTLFWGTWLSERGKADWPDLLRRAAEGGTDDNLASELQRFGRVAETAVRRKPKGGLTWYQVPVTAPATIAESEFNRFYVRGLCRRALDNHIETLEVYRAKEVANPRSASQALIGTHVDPAAVLNDVRSSPGVETALGIPPGPNSGLTVRLPG